MNKILPTVVRQGDQLLFNTGISTNYEIYYTDSPNFDNLSLLYESNLPSVKIAAPSPNRLFFTIKSSGFIRNFSTRHISNINIVNFRDLGGYMSSDGRRVKWGNFYRGAHLSNLNDDDLNKLNQIALNTIFDFRSKSEVAENPNIIPHEVSYINQSGIHIMETNGDFFSEDGNDNLDMVGLIVKYSSRPKELAELASFLPDFYLSMGRHPDTFVSFLQQVFHGSTPVFFHCSAGKDRTGFAASLILKILDASPNVIMEDYLLSNHYRRDDNEKVLNLVKSRVDNPKVIAITESMLNVYPQLLESTYKELNSTYGSFTNFLTSAVGVSKADILDFKNKHLE